jgi:predicted MPP superfamily phosphohydrolase
MRPLSAIPLGVAAVGAATLAYGAGYEVRSFRLRRVEVPVLRPGAPPLRVLHLSDIHMIPGQRRKRDWLRSLAALRPDVVVNTGDNLSHPHAVPAVMDALEPLLALPGVFVLGSNDYYAPELKNPARYLLPDDGRRATKRQNPWQDLRDGFTGSGWLDLSNARGQLKVDQREVEFAGLDDPHINRDRPASIAGPPEPGVEIAMGVVHAPYLRALDALTADRFPLILAGHTHGGQLRVPFYGALVTNCDLDRRRARGLSRHSTADQQSWLHVSAGCGSSRYAPVRIACPPEATLLTLTSAW